MEDEDLKLKVLTEELARKYDGKCYIDYDRNDWIEAFRFDLTDEGLSCHFVGTCYHIGYNHTLTDQIGSVWPDSAFMEWINMLEENCHLLKEITNDQFLEIVQLVEVQNGKIEHAREEFRQRREEIELKLRTK